jgi:hypothetical protein
MGISLLPLRSLQEEAVAIIDDLAEDPFPPGVVKMRKYKNR